MKDRTAEQEEENNENKRNGMKETKNGKGKCFLV
jgi:hypothetical protein